jgi:DNA-binding MarR family transcriptional regulator
VRAACGTQDGWLDRVRAGLLALLEFFDEEPALARYLVVQSAQAGPAVLSARREVLDRFAGILDDERAPARAYPPALTAEAVVNGVLGVLHRRLSEPQTGPLVDLAGPLMSFIVLPFLGARAARRELARPVDVTAAPVKPSVTVDLLQDPGRYLNHARTMRVLAVIGADPCLNSRGVARRAGVKDEGQMSRMLSRLERLGLIEDMRLTQTPSASRAWQLTPSGEALGTAVARATSALQRRTSPPRSAARDRLRDSGGRLNHRTVSVLRVIAAEPGLSNREVAERLGVKAKSHTSRLLARLARFGLIENTVAAPLPFEANAWLLTASGRELAVAIPDDGRAMAARASRNHHPAPTKETS